MTTSEAHEYEEWAGLTPAPPQPDPDEAHEREMQEQADMAGTPIYIFEEVDKNTGELWHYAYEDVERKLFLTLALGLERCELKAIEALRARKTQPKFVKQVMVKV